VLNFDSRSAKLHKINSIALAYFGCANNRSLFSPVTRFCETVVFRNPGIAK